MKKRVISIITAAVFILSAMAVIAKKSSDNSAAKYSSLFKKDSVIDINIDIDEKDLSDMYEYPKNEEYHSADITVNGIELKNSGIRTKGNMTLSSVASSDSDRYSYRIKFDKYEKGQTLLGLNELCLNNGYSDPSYMREYLHYEMLREMGQSVPETVFCNLYINGELYGFYLAVEAIDDSFLERNYGEDEKGNLYKMEEGASLVYKEDENYSYAELKSGSDKEQTGLKNFIKKLDSGDKQEIESVLDVDSALIHIASNTVLCNYDSYNSNMKHNYYLYENEDGVFSVLTWDVNMSFGGRESNTDIGIDTPIVSGNMESSPLISKLLAIDEYKEKYYGYIKEMMAWLEKLEERVDELRSVIKPYVENDPSAFYTVEEFEKATTYSGEAAEKTENGGEKGERGARGGFGGRKSILDIAAKRLENLKAQFDGTAEKSTLSGNSNGFGGFGGGNTPKDFDGEFPGGADGNMRGGKGGRMPKDFGGEMPGGADGNMPKDFDGEFPEGADGNMRGGRGGRMPKDFGGEMPEGADGNMPKDFDGEFPGGADGNMPKDFEGEFPGGADGNMPKDFDGEFPGGADGNMRGGKGGSPFGKGKQSGSIRVHLNGHILTFDEDPVLENDTTLVGFRAILEALGAEVSWDEASKTVTAVKDDTEIKLTIGSDTAYVNGSAVKLSAAPEISGSSTMIPVRFVSENLGMKVSWEADTKLITINSK